MDGIDTGIVAAVPADQQDDVDWHLDDYAIDGGADDDLDDVYAEPGDVVTDELGQ